MTYDEEPRPTTPLDEIYARLLREQPDNALLWERILERAKVAGLLRDTPEGGADIPRKAY